VTLHYPDVLTFINEYSRDDEEILATISRMKELSKEENQQSAMLRVELAIVYEYNDFLMRACYNLEGDSPNLITFAYDIWVSIRFLFDPTTDLKPTVMSVIKKFSGPDVPRLERWKSTVRDKLEPVRQYYISMDTKHDKFVQLMKCAKIFHPVSSSLMDFEQYDWNRLRSILPKKLLTDELFSLLQKELPMYRALSMELDPNTMATTFFNQNSSSLPTWKYVFSMIALELPSSAPAERGFSIFQDFFRGVTTATLQDLIEISVMRRYNFRNRTVPIKFA